MIGTISETLDSNLHVDDFKGIIRNNFLHTLNTLINGYIFNNYFSQKTNLWLFKKILYHLKCLTGFYNFLLDTSFPNDYVEIGAIMLFMTFLKDIYQEFYHDKENHIDAIDFICKLIYIQIDTISLNYGILIDGEIILSNDLWISNTKFTRHNQTIYIPSKIILDVTEFYKK